MYTVLDGVDKDSQTTRRDKSNTEMLIMAVLGEMYVHKQYSTVMLIIAVSMGEHHLGWSSLTKSDCEERL